MMKVLTIPGVRRVTLGDPSVLRAELLDGGLIWLVGVSMGATTLRVWTSKTEHADYLVNVAYDYGTNQLINLVRSAVANMEGVLVWKNGDRIILEGMTCTEADTERAAELAAASPDRLVNLTKFSRSRGNSSRRRSTRRSPKPGSAALPQCSSGARSSSRAPSSPRQTRLGPGKLRGPSSPRRTEPRGAVLRTAAAAAPSSGLSADDEQQSVVLRAGKNPVTDLGDLVLGERGERVGHLHSAR